MTDAPPSSPVDPELTMSGWNYRIIRHADHFTLHEVYYDDAGKPNGYTAEGIDISVDLDEGSSAIEADLKLMLSDVQRHPVIPVEDFSP